jgi:hypothetical protein
MRKLTYLIMILVLMIISLGMTNANSKVNMIDSSTYTSSTDRYLKYVATSDSQSDNITRTVLILGYDKNGNMIEDGSNVITLTPEQLAEADRLIEQYKKKYAQDPDRIRFGSGYIITVTAGTVDASILENGKTSGNDYYLIQFYTDMADLDKETRDTLNQIGCILYPGTENAFYAKIPPEALDTVISLVNSGKIRYLGRIPNEAKIRPELLSKMQANPDKSFQIEVRLYENPDSSQMDQLGNIMQFNSRYYSILNSVYGTIPGNRIQDIIDLSFVGWIEEQSYSTAANNDGTAATEVTQDKQDYLAVLNIKSAQNKENVLAVIGVEYIQDAVYTGTDGEKYPAIAISANEQAADQIRNLDSVIAVSPIAGISPVPASPQSDETIKETTNIRFITIAVIISLLVLFVILIVYLIIRRSNQS